MEELWNAGAIVHTYDPKATDELQYIYGQGNDLHVTSTKKATMKSADVLVICTEWYNF